MCCCGPSHRREIRRCSERAEWSDPARPGRRPAACCCLMCDACESRVRQCACLTDSVALANVSESMSRAQREPCSSMAASEEERLESASESACLLVESNECASCCSSDSRKATLSLATLFEGRGEGEAAEEWAGQEQKKKKNGRPTRPARRPSRTSRQLCRQSNIKHIQQFVCLFPGAQLYFLFKDSIQDAVLRRSHCAQLSGSALWRSEGAARAFECTVYR